MALRGFLFGQEETEREMLELAEAEQTLGILSTGLDGPFWNQFLGPWIDGFIEQARERKDDLDDPVQLARVSGGIVALKALRNFLITSAEEARRAVQQATEEESA